MGDPDQPHSYSYTPDVAAGLITLGTAAEAAGQIWHLPVAEARTTRQIVEHVYALAGTSPRIAGRRSIDPARARPRQAGDARVPAHALPVHRPVGRRRRKFRAAFGGRATPLDEALATTLGWYRRPCRRASTG